MQDYFSLKKIVFLKEYLLKTVQLTNTQQIFEKIHRMKGKVDV